MQDPVPPRASPSPCSRDRNLRPRGLRLPVALACCLLLAAFGAVASDFEGKARKNMEFAAEMAEKGLWREALYRWQRVLDEHPEDPRVLNNIAVAHEALGQRDEARRAYEKALSFTSTSEISANHALFERSAVGSGDSEPDGGGEP